MRAGTAGIRGYESERIDHPGAIAGPFEEAYLCLSRADCVRRDVPTGATCVPFVERRNGTVLPVETLWVI